MSVEEKIDVNNNIYDRQKSKNVESNPIVIQLIEFGYDKIYSRRVFYYLHPEDIEEALNYMAIDNGIIQHRFIKDNRNTNNQLCYICGQKENIHLKELNFININNNPINNDKNEINRSNNNSIYFNMDNSKINNYNKSNDIENVADNDSIYFSVDSNNIKDKFK